MYGCAASQIQPPGRTRFVGSETHAGPPVPAVPVAELPAVPEPVEFPVPVVPALPEPVELPAPVLPAVPGSAVIGVAHPNSSAPATQREPARGAADRRIGSS